MGRQERIRAYAAARPWSAPVLSEVTVKAVVT
jgi:hypothetical protein